MPSYLRYREPEGVPGATSPCSDSRPGPLYDRPGSGGPAGLSRQRHPQSSHDRMNVKRRRLRPPRAPLNSRRSIRAARPARKAGDRTADVGTTSAAHPQPPARLAHHRSRILERRSRPPGGPARPRARSRSAVRQDVRDSLAAGPAAAWDHPCPDRRGLHPAARTPALDAGPGPRRVRTRLCRSGVRRHAQRGGGHRQRALAEGLGQSCGAAEDRLHPGRARGAQPGLADRTGRRVGRPWER